MKILTVSAPRRNNRGTLDVTVTFENFPGTHPYTIEEGSALEAEVLNGDHGAIAPYIAPHISYEIRRRKEFEHLDAEGMDAIRHEIAAIRDGQPESAEYAAYRGKIENIKNSHPKDGD